MKMTKGENPEVMDTRNLVDLAMEAAGLDVDLEEARSRAEMIVAESPAAASFRYTFARILLALGDVVAAEQQILYTLWILRTDPGRNADSIQDCSRLLNRM